MSPLSPTVDLLRVVLRQHRPAFIHGEKRLRPDPERVLPPPQEQPHVEEAVGHYEEVREGSGAS